ncbi:hypothetical protein BDP27DRAFT_1363267 [Rhodocollybia butyracea]|uniref:Uncharacterized protein n=1 Tax=Rhodocollybia butyracea TaxID=206335 RepID=A0A9P5PP94_9AGAR|nr:hypothetical protein BDP27DRAFT_1363267 [Rhodocollybia butyracea]
MLLAPELGGESVEELIRKNHGKIHAKAGLMGHLQGLNINTEITLGVSKKSCFLCWTLYQTLNAARKPDKFRLTIHTHGMIFPGIPPSGVTEVQMEAVLTELLRLRPTFQPAHSRQSSGEATDIEELTVPLPETNLG